MSEVRDKLRGLIFSGENTKPKSEEVTFFGAQIEVRQPAVGLILDMRNAGTDQKTQMVTMLTTYCFVPGTDEHVFEEGDLDSLMALPWGSDFQKLQKVVASLTNLEVTQAAVTKNSDETASSST